jgi:tRNA(Ile)-lysidine synthase
MNDWSDHHAQLHQTLKVRGLLPAKSRVLIAVSGGQDSLCLLKLLCDLQPHWEWQLGVVHCDHQWRSDATTNAEHVRSLCHSWQVPIYIKTASTTLTGEAAARQWRYSCFQAIAQAANYAYVVTGHTASDRAETLLYNLVRGSGSDGLQALGWSRSLNYDCSQIQLVRPLLEFRREATAQICQTYQLPIWADSTNQDVQFARNRMRLEVLPYLHQHFNPQAEQHMAHTAELLSAEVDYLQAQATKIYNQATAPQQPQQIDRLVLRSQHIALQRRVIRQFLQATLRQAPNFGQIEAVVRLIGAPNRSQTATFSGGFYLRVCDRYLQIMQT